MNIVQKISRNKVFLLIILSFLLFLIGLVQLNQASMSTAFITVDTNMVDLGEIPINNGIVEAKYVLQNNGDEAVKIVRGETSCMCTEAEIKTEDGITSKRIKMPGHGSSAGSLDIVIPPKDSVTLVAYFDPMAHGPKGTGMIKRDVMLVTNSKDQSKITVSFKGNVIP